MNPDSLLERILAKLAKEAQTREIETGQGRKGGKDKFDENVGFSKGMRRAIELVVQEAKSIDRED